MPRRVDVEDDPTSLLILSDGSVYGNARISLTESDYRRMKQGYTCPWCLEELRHAFDRTCRGWDWGPNEQVSQAEWHAFMDAEYQGEEHLGATQAQIDSQIWTPGG